MASALRACALHVFPELASCITAFDVPCEQAREVSYAQVQALLPQDREVLICTDVCDATPFNIAQDLANANGCELLTGANVPMVVRGLGYSHEPIAEMIDKAIEGAPRHYVDRGQRCAALRLQSSRACIFNSTGAGRVILRQRPLYMFLHHGSGLRQLRG